LELTFFILPPEYRSSLFKQIHEIVFHGKGGYDWDTVYNMPIWLRRFTFNEINEFYIKEREEFDKAHGNSQTLKSSDQIATAVKKQLAEKPTYSSKVSKK
jgi:hypothetical protein